MVGISAVKQTSHDLFSRDAPQQTWPVETGLKAGSQMGLTVWLMVRSLLFGWACSGTEVRKFSRKWPPVSCRFFFLTWGKSGSVREVCQVCCVAHLSSGLHCTSGHTTTHIHTQKKPSTALSHRSNTKVCNTSWQLPVPLSTKASKA